MPRLPLLVACLAACVIAACDEGPRAADRPGFDSQVVWADAASPFIHFDGGLGSMMSGPGWAPPEGDGGRGNWGSYAWVAAPEAKLWFTPSFDEAVDFYARCLPYPFDAVDPPQELTLLWNGVEVGRAELEPGWHEVRLPLPRVPRRGELQELTIRFRKTTKPSEITDSADSRNLAAAFSVAAVVPRSVRSPGPFLRAARIDGANRRIELPVGGAFSVPLPEATRGVIRLGAAVSSCPSCRVEVDLLGGQGEARRLWQGGLAELPGASIRFQTAPGAISRLVARVKAPEPAASPDLRRVALSLPDGWLRRTQARSPPAEERPDVFIYLVDTLRADVLAAYGGAPDLAPRMNEFAQRAVVYDDARAASSWTLPSVVSILTGVYPFRHHVMKGDVKLDSKGLPGMGRLLAASGYQTVGISQSFVASGAFGVDGEFEDFFLSNQLNSRKLRSQALRKALVQWLTGRAQAGAPVFAYLHSVDPHAPYTPPAAFRTLARNAPGDLPENRYLPSVFMTEGLASSPREVAHLRALYLGEVAYTDRQFGLFLDLLRRLDLYDRSLIVLVSDHGEEFAEHGGFDHGRTLYDELLRIPLVVKFPGNRWGGTRVQRPVSTVDLLPTVLALGGATSGGLPRHGVDLAPGSNETDAPSRRAVFAEVSPVASAHAGAVDLRALSVAGIKCIQNRAGVDQFGKRAPAWSVFDLAADPGEQAPLAPANTRSRRCREALKRWLAARQAEDAAAPRAPATSEAARNHLRALGYID